MNAMNGSRQGLQDQFVRRENVRRYEKLIDAETDEAKRKMLRGLLSAERKMQNDNSDPMDLW